jgi:UDP-3-O-[3-hydroxymyristoyl] glucosamine N-acyltransferase
MLKTVAALADLIGGDVHQVDPTLVMEGVKSLTDAAPNQLSFYEPSQHNKLALSELKNSQAGVVITTETFKNECPHGAMIVKQPKIAFAKVASLFEKTFKPKRGVHPSAIIGENCVIDDTVCIAAGAVIGDGAVLKENVMIGANAVIGEQVTIGAYSRVFANVTIYPEVTIGERVSISSGTVIGADGFGFVPDEKGEWQRLPQLGSVVIHDDVNIGASCTIDCGALSDTVLEQGVKLDDQVHIAHNVVIGAHTILAGYCAIAGSVTIGKHCILAGGVSTVDNISITDKVIVTAGSGVSRPITEPGVYGCGIAVAPMKKWSRILARLYQLDDLAKRLIRMEKKINE